MSEKPEIQLPVAKNDHSGSSAALSDALKEIEASLRHGGLEQALARTHQAIASVGEHPRLTQLCEKLKQGLAEHALNESCMQDEQTLKGLLDKRDYPAAMLLGERITRRWPERGIGWSLLSEAFYRQGDYRSALTAARHAVSCAPCDTILQVNLGVMLEADGDSNAAEQTYLDALKVDPNCYSAHVNLGSLLRNRGDLTAAENCYRKALALQPDQAEIHFNLGNVLQELGRKGSAEASFRRALDLQPEFAAAASNLAGLLFSERRLQEAADLFRQARQAAPNLIEASCSLSRVLRALKQLPEALDAATQAATEAPDHSEAWLQLGLAQTALERFDDARQSLRRALVLEPDRVDIMEALASVCAQTQDSRQAAELLRKAIQLAAGNADLHIALGTMLARLGEDAEAERAHRSAVKLAPESAQAHAALGDFLCSKRRFSEALAEVDQALLLDPQSAWAVSVRARALQCLGLLGQCETAYRRLLALQPENAQQRSAMLAFLAYTCRLDVDEQRKQAQHWEIASLSEDERKQAANRHFSRQPADRRRLRVGLLSNELFAHPVAFFLRSWLGELDRSRFELFVYPSTRSADTDDARGFIGPTADHWHSLAGLSDLRATERILADAIDVLVETSGHDAGNRLGVIARRAAPVQCHYIGYYATTGVSRMDYFIGDEVLIPKEHDAHFVEKIWRLPRTRYVYDPLWEAPPPKWWPDPGGRIWVGSFNNLIKVGEPSLRLWAQVLHALPEAHLVLKDFKGANRDIQKRILGSLAEKGIPEQRVALLAATPDWCEHMAYYNRLDVALDTVPFNSATTGFDALWMGCPLVTLRGDRLAGRQAESLLTGLGRQEWVARDKAEFVDIVVRLARDLGQRQSIRKQQRQRMASSELCDGLGLARALETAFETMFRDWCRKRNQAASSG